MLVKLRSGEQRLITFTLPTESCTVLELLEQVGILFSPESKVQCTLNSGGDVDYIVTEGENLPENSVYLDAAVFPIESRKQQMHRVVSTGVSAETSCYLFLAL